MKELKCRNCYKTMGYVKDDIDIIEVEDCLCAECHNKAKDEKVDFTILQSPSEVRLYCPYCDEEISIDWEDFEYNNIYWGDISGETIECPHCNQEITLGDYEVD